MEHQVGERAGLPYKPLPHVVVRSAALPSRNMFGLTFLRARVLVDAAVVRDAIDVASPSFAEALTRVQNANSWKARDDVTVLKYLNRMSSRPAPYGLFAGLGVARVGDTTSAHISRALEPVYQPDMGWLSGWIAELQARPEVLEKLTFRAHPAVVTRGGRLAIHSAVRCDDHLVTTARAGPLIARLLTMARDWVPYAELVRGQPDRSRVRDVIVQLCELGFLVSSLQIAPGDPDPLTTLTARLPDVAEMREERRRISMFQASAAGGAGSSPGSNAKTTHILRSALLEMWKPADGTECLQVDAVRPMKGELNGRLAADAAELAHLLLQVSPYAGVDDEFEACRSALVEDFGSEAWIDVPSALDTLDLVAERRRTQRFSGNVHRARARRDQQLAELALGALGAGAVVELDAGLLAKLAITTLDTLVLPDTLDICVQVAASSSAAIDAGAYQMVAAPAVGAPNCGRMIGRFGASLREQGVELSQAIAEASTQTCPSSVIVEARYVPFDRRTMNVTARSCLSGPTLYLDPVLRGDGQQRFELQDLRLQLHEGKLSLWLADGSRSVIVVRRDMIHRRRVPFVIRFLESISASGKARLSGFDWGATSLLPALPRVQMGRLILALAEWQLNVDWMPDSASSDRSRFLNAITAWRESRALPRHVYLADADRRLLIDLDEPDHIEVLRAELKDKRSIKLQEGIPGPDEAWLPDEAGDTYASELVFSLVRHPPMRESVTRRASETRGARVFLKQPADPRQSLHFPGSEWVYLKLYIVPDAANQLLVGDIAPKVRDLQAEDATRDWFFVRYADPDFHIRLRLRAATPEGQDQLLVAACSFARRLGSTGTVLRFSVETYEPEVARYGGPEGVAFAERVFTLDSMTSLALLEQASMPEELSNITIISLADLPTPATEYGPKSHTMGIRTRDGGRAYRQKRSDLLTAWQTHIANGDASTISAILLERRVTWVRFMEELARAAATGRIQQDPQTLFRSYQHMHCNRMGLSQSEETQAVELSQRLINELEHRGSISPDPSLRAPH